MNTPMEWPEDPFADDPDDDALAGRLSTQRYGALVTLSPAGARAVLDATDRLAEVRPGAEADPAAWFGTARAAAFAALTPSSAVVAVPATATGTATSVYRQRALEALAVLPAVFRSAVALVHVCELDLAAVARVEQTEPVLARMLVRGAEYVLVQAMAGAADQIVTGDSGTVDLDWLAANLPADTDGDHAPGRAPRLGGVLCSVADAIVPATVGRAAESGRRPTGPRGHRRPERGESRARSLLAAAAVLTVTVGVATTFVLGNREEPATSTGPVRPTVALPTTTTPAPKARPAAKANGPATSRSTASTRARRTTTTAVGAPGAVGPATTRRTTGTRPPTTTTASTTTASTITPGLATSVPTTDPAPPPTAATTASQG